MRLLSCKTHCPRICFYERAPPQVHAPRTLKLENAVPSVDSTVVSDPACADGLSVRRREVKDGMLEDKREEGRCESLKSILRKTSSIERKEVPAKQVRWVDFAGKELIDVREFASSETDSMDMDRSRSCECIIL